MRTIWMSLFALFLFTCLGFSQIPTSGNVFFGYSYLNGDNNVDRVNLNGWNGSLEGKILPWVGIVADLSGHYGSEAFSAVIVCPPSAPNCNSISLNTHQYNFLFGPRVSMKVGKITPFAQFLVGAGHLNASGSGVSESDTSFAEAIGGGLDYKLVHGLGWRFQGDFLQTRFFSNTQNNFRFSTGLVLHF